MFSGWQKVCIKIIEISFYLLFITVPLVLTPWNYELFEYNKMMVVYGLTAVITCFWIAKAILLKKLLIKKSSFNKWVLLFLAGQIVTTFSSIDIHTSVWGYYSRFHGGLLSTISYTLLYFAFLNNFDDLKHLKRLLLVSLATGFVVSLYAVLEHFGIDKNLWVQDVQNRVFSTLGQPNWLAAYLVILLPILMGLIVFVQKNTRGKFLFFTSYFLLLTFYSALLYTKSRSGFLAFWISNLVFWLLIFTKLRFIDLKKTMTALLIITSSLLILTFFIGGASLGSWEKYSFSKLTQKKQPEAPAKPTGESLIETGITESGEIRKIVWQGAWQIFLYHPILGTGPETFAYSYYQYRPAEHNMTSEWDFLYNKAHNEYLNLLANSGLIGLLPYLGFILTSLWYGIKKGSLEFNIFYSALTASFVSILITNFFGFSVVIVSLCFYLIPVLYFLLEKKKAESTSFKLNVPAQTAILPAAFSLVIFFLLFQMWQADVFFARGYRANRSSGFVEAYENLTKAVQLNSLEPFYMDELAFTSGVLSIAFGNEKDATNAASLKTQAEALSNKVVSENPRNLNFLKSRIRLYYALSTADPKKKEEVLYGLERAAALAPTDPKIAYNLGVIYAQSGQVEKANKILQNAVKLKPDFRDAHFGYALFLRDQKQNEKALAQLNFILTKLDPNDREAKKKLEEWK